MALDCLFCKLIAGEIPANVVYLEDQVFAFRDINPQAPTHILIIPKRHIPGVLSVTREDAEVLEHIFQVAAELAKQEGIADSGFRLVVNSGPDAGQTVHHLHFHLLGGRLLGWPPG